MTKNNHNIPEDYNKTVAAHKNAEKPPVLAGAVGSKPAKTPIVKRLQVSKKSLKSSTVLVTLVALLVIGTVATYLYSQRDKRQEVKINIPTSNEIVTPEVSQQEIEQLRNKIVDNGVIGQIDTANSKITVNVAGVNTQFTYDVNTVFTKGLSSPQVTVEEVKVGDTVSFGYNKNTYIISELWVVND